VKSALERELKLDAEPGFELPPDLGEPLPGRLFTSTYHDTPARSLLRCGLTLRRRVEGGGALWQLKLPREEGRQELEAPGGPARLPDELLRLLGAHLRHGPLEPVATLRTRRTGYRVVDGDRVVAEVTVDVVDALVGARLLASFREVEAELVDGDRRDLQRLDRTLRRAGAAASNGRPKVARVVGLAEEPPDPLALRRQLRELERFDPGVRLGDDPEDLHRFRVAPRRSRAIIRVTRPVLGEALEPLSAELAWLAGVLGPVRDLDVLIDHLRPAVADLDVDEAAGEELVAILEEERSRLRTGLAEALDSPRYLALLDRFERDVAAVRLEREDELPALAAAAFKRLRRRGKALRDDDSDDALHDLRKSGKKARYAAELVPAANGKEAARYVDSVKTLQDVIGEHQDAVVAEAALRRIARARTAVAAGRLIAAERERRRRSRAATPEALADVVQRGKAAFP
jgi:CHAD domain-containing protein